MKALQLLDDDIEKLECRLRTARTEFRHGNDWLWFSLGNVTDVAARRDIDAGLDRPASGERRLSAASHDREDDDASPKPPSWTREAARVAAEPRRPPVAPPPRAAAREKVGNWPTGRARHFVNYFYIPLKFKEPLRTRPLRFANNLEK
jgi:hypothetical protein